MSRPRPAPIRWPWPTPPRGRRSAGTVETRPGSSSLPSTRSFTRCATIRFEASYQVPALTLPWVGGQGAGFTATARHAEIVDPFRDGVPAAATRCDDA